MKKILFATTALVATAGMAAADMTLSGFGRVGLDYSAAGDTTMDYRWQLGITGSVETSSGTTFKIYSRARFDDGDAADGGFNAPTVTISSGDFTLQLGNTYSAAGARTNVFGSGTGNLGNYGLYDTFATWYASGVAGTSDRVRADYTMNGMTISVSGDVDGDERIEAGVSGSAGSLNYGVAASDDDYYAADVNMAMGDMKVGARLTNTINGMYANYSFGDTSVQGYYGDNDDWAIGFSHDLGGASLGAEYNETGAGNITVAFSF